MRLYLTGGTGLLGSNIIVAARRRGWEITATQYGPPPQWQVDYRLEPLDLADPQAVRASIGSWRPEVVIHAAALLDQVFMYRQRERAWDFMVEGTNALARACREVGARLLFVSTDWVFDGRQPLVHELSPPFPLNFYGIMKMVGEQLLTHMDGLDCAIGRLAAVYGLNRALPAMTRWRQGIGLGDLPNYYFERFRKQQAVEVWSGPVNEAAHPTLADDAAEMLVKLAGSDLQGIFHTCGAESVSRLELAHRCAAVFGGDPELIREVPLDSGIARAHAGIRPPYRLRMSVERTARALDHHPYKVVDGLEKFRAQLEEEEL